MDVAFYQIDDHKQDGHKGEVEFLVGARMPQRLKALEQLLCVGLCDGIARFRFPFRVYRKSVSDCFSLTF